MLRPQTATLQKQAKEHTERKEDDGNNEAGNFLGEFRSKPSKQAADRMTWKARTWEVNMNPLQEDLQKLNRAKQLIGDGDGAGAGALLKEVDDLGKLELKEFWRDPKYTGYCETFHRTADFVMKKAMALRKEVKLDLIAAGFEVPEGEAKTKLLEENAQKMAAIKAKIAGLDMAQKREKNILQRVTMGAEDVRVKTRALEEVTRKASEAYNEAPRKANNEKFYDCEPLHNMPRKWVGLFKRRPATTG